MFDPVHFNGTIFDLDRTSRMATGSMRFGPQPIPASYFPKSLVFVSASVRLPDMFHMSRGYFVVSERARAVMEHWASGEVEFIPVSHQAKPKVAATLKFDRAYYFINILGHAQRLMWRETPAQDYQSKTDDGADIFGLHHGFTEWVLRAREPGEPLIWREEAWRDGDKEYRAWTQVFIEDVLWRELDANFPDQLHALEIS
ncbi:imm11 family protein [Bradyrhizobium sp. HKCCYLS20291]|uniref:imm11 family protein n=1 Tax=Bradyrhizobium sp. HKCCYLS20291 TaxID=3420766 RepID=UPI003EB6D63D